MKIAYLYGDFDDSKTTKGRRPKILPNPLPDTIDKLALLAATTTGLAHIVYKLIALWVQRENAKFIRIKDGEKELEVHGGVSSKEVERAFNQFRKALKEADEERLKIILPPGVDRSVPIDMLKTAHAKKASKKGGKK